MLLTHSNPQLTTLPPEAPASPLPSLLLNTFDRVVVINLARRPERLAQFRQTFATNWPFKPPQRFEAINGLTVDPPPTWEKGRGAWGCMLSHRAVLASAIADRVSSLLVLEDDALPVPDFPRLARQFLANVPRDWECLMFGGEHLFPPIPLSPGASRIPGTRGIPGPPGTPGVVRCTGCNRTHAYAMRRRMMGATLQRWHQTTNRHCDIVLASLMGQFKTFAPDPFLIAQAPGQSDITNAHEPLRFV